MSPPGADSTLITSAPISASIRVQVGPASARVKSSTRSPVNTCSLGMMPSFSPECFDPMYLHRGPQAFRVCRNPQSLQIYGPRKSPFATWTVTRTAGATQLSPSTAVRLSPLFVLIRRGSSRCAPGNASMAGVCAAVSSDRGFKLSRPAVHREVARHRGALPQPARPRAWSCAWMKSRKFRRSTAANQCCRCVRPSRAAHA